MKKIVFILLFFGTSLVFASFENSYFLYKEKEFEIELDTRTPSKNKGFSFADYDIKAPDICKSSHIFCYEKTKIHTTINKEWEVVPVPPIWDKSLTPQQFAKFYPDLEEDKIINNWSPAKDKWITQRILYERGLLPVFPTGKIGFLTEEAIIKLQFFKGIEEIDQAKGVVIIGPQTIKELNKLKKRMEDETFVSRSPYPEINFADYSDFHQKRLLTIDKELKRRKYLEEKEQLVPKLPIIKPKNSDKRLQLSGEASIKITQE
jgi:hypothetical protein